MAHVRLYRLPQGADAPYVPPSGEIAYAVLWADQVTSFLLVRHPRCGAQSCLWGVPLHWVDGVMSQLCRFECLEMRTRVYQRHSWAKYASVVVCPATLGIVGMVSQLAEVHMPANFVDDDTSPGPWWAGAGPTAYLHAVERKLRLQMSAEHLFGNRFPWENGEWGVLSTKTGSFVPVGLLSGGERHLGTACNERWIAQSGDSGLVLIQVESGNPVGSCVVHLEGGCGIHTKYNPISFVSSGILSVTKQVSEKEFIFMLVDVEKSFSSRAAVVVRSVPVSLPLPFPLPSPFSQPPLCWWRDHFMIAVFCFKRGGFSTVQISVIDFPSESLTIMNTTTVNVQEFFAFNSSIGWIKDSKPDQRALELWNVDNLTKPPCIVKVSGPTSVYPCGDYALLSPEDSLFDSLICASTGTVLMILSFFKPKTNFGVEWLKHVPSCRGTLPVLPKAYATSSHS
ncbi:hypothetical protein Pelo_4585 [Pelomyxa schiedti]|nr:hypothetical protein Pelo_4585 [Pelomyxa schiedti]